MMETDHGKKALELIQRVIALADNLTEEGHPGLVDTIPFAEMRRLLQDAGVARTIELPVRGIRLFLNGAGSGTISCDDSDDMPAAGHAVLSVILGHACAGIDVTTPAYLDGIETAFEAIANHHDDDEWSDCITEKQQRKIDCFDELYQGFLSTGVNLARSWWKEVLHRHGFFDSSDLNAKHERKA